MTRSERIRRLGLLYRRMEQMRAAELHHATSDVADVVAVQQQERIDAWAETGASRTALAAGDTQEWMLAEAGRELIGLRMLRHCDVQVRLEQVRESAADIYQQRRVQREQMERIASARRRAEEELEGRRAQAAADDRFLSRRAWLRGHSAKETNAPKS